MPASAASFDLRSSDSDGTLGRVAVAAIPGTARKATSVTSYCVPCHGSLCLLLALASDNLNLLCFDVVRVIKLELDILDNERPDFITEAIGVEVSLKKPVSTCHSQIICSGEVSIP